MARRTLLITYVATYLVAIGTVVRYLTGFRDEHFWSIALLLGVYLILIFAEPVFIRRNRFLIYVYLFVQTAIVCTLATITPGVDFWATLFFPLVMLVMHNFAQQTGFLITGIFTMIMVIFMLLGIGLKVGLPLVFINGVVYFFLAAFIAILGDAIAARKEVEKQQTELQSAYQQLQTYTARAEELAVLEERNRLARELHDSITQSLHSSTLLAEAGQRLASSGDLERARGYLIRLGEISQQALREMRLLVYELRPLELEGVGLVEALQQRLDAVERRSGVEVLLSVEEGLKLPRGIEEELFRVAMEALNNALKHAKPTTIKVSLRIEYKRAVPCIELAVTDDGMGFDPDMKDVSGGLGLISMQERIRKLGGELTILSAPGEGTQVKACANLETTPVLPES